MPLRRIFLLGAAGLASLAALVAIGAVVSGNFGETEGRIFATIATTFVAGSTALAAIAFLARGASPPLGYIGLALAVFGYLLWAEQIWAEHDSDRYWEFLGIVLAWTLAALITMTNRLLLHSPRLVRTLYPATAAMAGLAATTVTVMVLRENGDGWQLFAIFVILAVLGEILAPILDRYAASGDAPAERVLGTVAGAAVIAVRGDRGVVRIGEDEIPLRSGERVVVRAGA
jgi:FtsH-binding integral membrane protein